MNWEPIRKAKWPKSWISWDVNGITYISVPFTWLLKPLRSYLKNQYKFNDIVVGGPAVKAMPEYLSGIKNITVNTGDIDGVLQKFEPLATKTTYGCIRNCKFCLVKKTEGKFIEKENWPNLPIICDNNIVASSGKHFEKVINGLVEKWQWADFNGGIDVRILKKYHTDQMAKLKKIILRIALDDMSYISKWENALSLFKESGIKKNSIRSYVLIGFNDTPKEAKEKCTYVEKNGIMPIPMWFRKSDSMYKNKITEEQKKLGWSNYERLKIMSWFYNRTDIDKIHFKKTKISKNNFFNQGDN